MSYTCRCFFSPSFSASDELWVHQQHSRPNQNEDLSDLSWTKNAHGLEIPCGYTPENLRLEPKNQPCEKGTSFEPNLHDLCSKLGKSLVVPYTVSPSPFKFGWVVNVTH